MVTYSIRNLKRKKKLGILGEGSKSKKSHLHLYELSRRKSQYLLNQYAGYSKRKTV
jgi:hypothetical protein